MFNSQVAITDEEIVRAMVEEVEQVMSRPLFCAALKVPKKASFLGCIGSEISDRQANFVIIVASML